MPTTTPNYGLALYNSTTDGAQTFLAYRTAIAGIGSTSNMNLIDTAMGDIQDQIDALEGRKGIVSVSASFISSNYYEATTVDITAYEAGQIIALKLDTTSDGTVTLNINALGTKSVMKANSAGTYVNIDGSDLRVNKEYNFKYDGTRWVWMDATSGDQINVNGTSGNFAKIGSTNSLEDSLFSDASFVKNSLFDANTILAANTDNTPAALTIGETEMVGRQTGGNIGSIIQVTGAEKAAMSETLLRGFSPYDVAQLGQLGNEFGGSMTWTSATGYDVLPGRKIIDGLVLQWSSTRNIVGLSLSVSTLYYVYVYNNLGSASFEEVTTAPTWNSTYRYWQKTGDATRRLVGTLRTNSSGDVVRFFTTINSNTMEYIYLGGDAMYATPFLVVSAGTQAASWDSIDLSGLIPSVATHWYCAAKIAYTNANDDGVVGMSPVDLGTVTGSGAPYTIRNANPRAGSRTFFGRVWMHVVTSQTGYYRIANQAGTVATYIECHGYKLNI